VPGGNPGLRLSCSVWIKPANGVSMNFSFE